MDVSFRAKVGGFGLHHKRNVNGLPGLPFWMAPELLVGGTPTRASDVYSFGGFFFVPLPPRFLHFPPPPASS